MRKFLIVLAVVLGLLSFAGTISISVKAGDVEVPFVIKMGQLIEIIPEDFEPDWTSLKVYFDSKEVPYQIDDVDGNKRISAPDYLVFLGKGQGKIVVADQAEKATVYSKAFSVTKADKNFIIKSTDGTIEVAVNEKGIVKVNQFGNAKGTLVDEIGIARIAGWSRSTYYVNGDIGNQHDEETSSGLRVVELKVFDPGPVAVGVKALLQSDKFFGLTQDLLVYIFKNGDIYVDNNFIFYNYADIMKLQTMITKPLIPAFDDTVHILPVFRRLAWADQLGVTPYEYWLERNAIKMVNNIPYIVFPAGQSMKPLFWGATYIFASVERWRTNYTEKGKIGIAEVFPAVPIVMADYKKWLEGDTWVYESLEFRTGIFKWIADEFNAYPATDGVYPVWGTNKEAMPNRYKAGDKVEHTILYTLYNANSVDEAIKFVEEKSKSFRMVKIGE
ncbi:MAG: hypothetical protein ACK4E1_00035 [Fervidobacterium nodosum]